jgi:hypothetical protein
MLLMPLLVQAGPVLITGTPADDSTLPNTAASPKLGGVLINFDSLASCPSFPPSGCTNYSGTAFTGGVAISSSDGLYAIPYSAQTSPNELYDNSAAGSANISIVTPGTTAVGAGISDSDITAGGAPVTIFLQALNSGGAGFGTLFSVTLPETGGNPGNGYFVIQDTSFDIYGLRISQPAGDANYSGLAIDDVQVAPAPEPSTFLLLIGGAAIVGSCRMRRRA